MTAGPGPTDGPLSVVQVVVTNGFAGVERYVCQVSGELARRGHRIHTIGGDPARMRAELPESVPNRTATTLVSAALALVRRRHVDLIHVHMTSAEGAAWLARPNVRLLVAGPGHVESVCRLLAKAGTAGNLVTDAQVAALALEYGATVHSADTDFARFKGVRWENPLLTWGRR